MPIHDRRPKAPSRGPTCTVGVLPVLGAALLLGALITPAGCMVGPDFTRPTVTVAAGWSAAGDPRIARQAAVNTLWWTSFGDPVLDRLVELAYRQNLPLQVAGLRIVEARARLGIATGNWYPQVQEAFLTTSGVGVSERAPGASSLADRRYLDFELGFDVSWELDFWGKYKRGIQAEAAALLATVADYQDALVSLTAEVARTYAMIRTFEVLLAQARENAQIEQEAVQIADSRWRNGATSELDVSQATTQYESTRATIPQLEAQLQQARNALATLLGQPAGAIDGLLAGPTEIPRAPASVAIGVPAELLRRRPDIRAAELLAAAQCARIGVAKAELYPSFSLLGTFEVQSTAHAGVGFNPFSADSIGYSVGPQVHWPFFNYGRLRNSVRVEDARFQQLLVGYQEVVLRAAQEVEDALTGFLRSQDAVVFLESSVTSARRSVEIALVQYREGAVDFQRVLDAQRSLLQVQNSLAQARSSVATNLISLYKALGGGWELREGEPVVPDAMRRQMRARTNWGHMLPRPRAPETGSPPPGKR